MYPRENSGGKRLNGTGKRQQKQNGAECPRIVGGTYFNLYSLFSCFSGHFRLRSASCLAGLSFISTSSLRMLRHNFVPIATKYNQVIYQLPVKILPRHVRCSKI